MQFNELQKQTNTNIQEKANLIWESATHLVGLFKPHEYGKVILPMTVLKRFDDALAPTKQAVLEMKKKLDATGANEQLIEGALTRTSGYAFYNTSKFDFQKLLADPDNIADNFDDYLKGFSANVADIISRFEFANTVGTMVEGGVLFVMIQEFNSAKADMSPKKITSADMGYIFEELIRKFSESYDEQAGAHFTSRDVIYLMTDLLISPEKEEIKENGCTKTAYDMAMGTSQMLGCLTERLQALSEDAVLTCFGQEFNPETYAIAKSDMLIKGGNASGMMYGDTLSQDKFSGYEFDYIISNPPFGIDWKRERTEVEAEAKKGYDGRFGPGLPAISDGQMLFMLNGVKKLKEGSGRMAIVQNGSSLFTGDAGSGASEIRRYVIGEDLVDAIIQLPTDLFYNTGIATYIWVLTKGKEMHRAGKVQLIDASKCFVKRRKNIGNKRVDLDENCIRLILKAYKAFEDGTFTENDLTVESKVYDNEFFGYTKVTVETALCDDEGKPILKKGKMQAVKGASDSEIIPLQDDIDAYIENNVLPYNAVAFLDRSKDKVGYEIPFTRLFYKFVPPEPSDSIFAEIKELEVEETELMKELFGNA
jgi:type I restriction enzyme M protein